MPIPLTEIVGRHDELRGISEAVRRTRLVTITGPGGVGKTRLAIEVARAEAASFSDGASLADLTAVPPNAEMAPAVARAVGLNVAAGDRAIAALREYFLERNTLLLLDNCEHVIGGCMELTEALLAACGGLRILTTSRGSLGVMGETVWRLGPLDTVAARRLFVERARQRVPDFVPTRAAQATVDRLCDRLERMPLAIELAAGWLSVMTIAELHDVVAAGLGGLADIRGRAARHGTVAATVDWSYRLLEPVAQAALRRLAVFIGGFDANAALAVVEGGSLRLLAQLVDMSLVVVASSSGPTRYRLLEPVREYAGEQLVDAGELDTARAAHCTYFRSLAETAREDWLATGRQRAVNELDADYENIRAGLDWLGRRDPCAARALLSGTRDLFFRFGQSEGSRLARQLLDGCSKHDALRIETQIAVGQLAITLSDFATARNVLADARRLSQSLEDPLREAWVSFFQGLAETLSGAIGPGREHLEASRAMHRELGISIGESRATSVLGGTYVMSGELDRGRELLERSLEICVREDERWGQGQAHTFLGLVAEDEGEERSAASHYRQAMALLRPSQDATLLPVVLIGQAAIVLRRDPGSAIRILAAAIGLRSRVGGELAPFYRARLERVREQAMRRCGADVDVLWAEGRRLDVDDAIDLAFGTSRRTPGPADSELSARELEVSELVAEGLANKAIAARLNLSARTVESHVRHSLTKLGLDNRTQLATWVAGRSQ